MGYQVVTESAFRPRGRYPAEAVSRLDRTSERVTRDRTRAGRMSAAMVFHVLGLSGKLQGTRGRYAAGLGLALTVLASCRSARSPEIDIDSDGGVPTIFSPSARKPGEALRFSVAAMQSPRDTYAAYSRLFAHLSPILGADIEIVQRRTYREVNDLLIAGKVDVAFVCTGGYFDLLRRAPGVVEIIAVPVMGGTTTYQALIIVPATSPAARMEDLAGKRFAFADELSFTGHAYPTYLVRAAGLNPPRFFSAAFFTHSHDRSILAVASGVVDGAAVDSHILDGMVAHEPGLARQVRVLRRSPPFGIPPVVARTSLPDATRARIREALLGLDSEPEGLSQLRELHIERFSVPALDLYDAAAVVVEGGE